MVDWSLARQIARFASGGGERPELGFDFELAHAGSGGTLDRDGLVDQVARLDGSTVVIQGPPGTGKSTTLAEVLGQLVTRDKNVTVLVCSHSNHGTDNPFAPPAGELAHELHRLFEERLRLLEVDDVDLVAMAEDERGHLRVPVAGLVSEMDARFQHLSH